MWDMIDGIRGVRGFYFQVQGSFSQPGVFIYLSIYLSMLMQPALDMSNYPIIQEPTAFFLKKKEVGEGKPAPQLIFIHIIIISSTYI